MVNFLLSQRQQNLTSPEVGSNHWKTPNNRFGSYENFLRTFQDHGYRFCFYDELKDPKRQIVLRHDIDFDTNFALQSALIEKQLGIKATYFFLLRSNFYNIFSPQDHENILLIQEMGHKISIHFDPSIYEDFHKGLQMEVLLFREFFQLDVEIISLHRPNTFFRNTTRRSTELSIRINPSISAM